MLLFFVVVSILLYSIISVISFLFLNENKENEVWKIILLTLFSPVILILLLPVGLFFYLKYEYENY